MKTITPSQLKHHVENAGGNFFSRDSMKFFGDTMQNYTVTGPVSIETWSEDQPVLCWQLNRRRPVKHGLDTPAFFDCTTYERRHPKN